MTSLGAHLDGSPKHEASAESIQSTSAGAGSLDSFLGLGDPPARSSSGVLLAGAGAASGAKPENRVFVSRIPADLKEADVRIYFDGFGKLCDFYMPAGRDGGHKGRH